MNLRCFRRLPFGLSDPPPPNPFQIATTIKPQTSPIVTTSANALFSQVLGAFVNAVCLVSLAAYLILSALPLLFFPYASMSEGGFTPTPLFIGVAGKTCFMTRWLRLSLILASIFLIDTMLTVFPAPPLIVTSFTQYNFQTCPPPSSTQRFYKQRAFS